MIDTLIKLVEKIIEIIQHKNLSKEQFFRNVIEPLFNELQLVVDDYFALFFNSRNLILSKTDVEIQECISEIRKAREAMFANRIKVREMVDTIGEKYNDRRINGFASNISSFFFSTRVLDKESKPSSRGAQLLELLDYINKENLSKDDLLHYINETIKKLENSWISIAQSYASIRVYFLNP